MFSRNGRNRCPSTRKRHGDSTSADRTGRIATAGLRTKKTRTANVKPIHAERENVNKIPKANVTRENQRVPPRNRGAGPHEAPSDNTRATARSPPYAFGSRSIPERRAPS